MAAASEKWAVAAAAKEEDGEGSFPQIRFHSRDTCSIEGAGLLGWLASWVTHCSCAAWATNESGEVGQPGKKGEEGQARHAGYAEMEEGLGSGLNGI
jgi:hypothetical protein